MERVTQADSPDRHEVHMGRRVFLGTVTVGVAGVLFGGSLTRVLRRATAPLGDLAPTGRFRIYSVTGELPERSRAGYRLEVTGEVRRPLDLSYDDLLAMPRTELVRDFQCVTGWRVEDVPWAGVRLADLLDLASPGPAATAVTFRSFDGVYTESLTLEQARRDDVMVAYEMLGGPVTREHGGPVRLYVAPMYGYKSCKWLETIEVTRTLGPGYWEVRGYDQHAWVGRSNGRSDAAI